MVGGVIAGALLGPLGVLLVAANSYSTSVTGRGLLGNFHLQSPIRTDAGQ